MLMALVQNGGNSIALAMELPQFCTKLSIYNSKAKETSSNNNDKI